VFNERTYPNLIALFAELGVQDGEVRHVVLGARCRAAFGRQGAGMERQHA
jgi:hypothetical protein